MIHAISDDWKKFRRIGPESLRLLSTLGVACGLVPRDGAAVPAAQGLTEQQVKDIIARDGQGDSRRAIRVMAKDRAKAAERARVAEEKLADLEKKGRIAPEGAVIVQGDDAKSWPDVQKFLTDNKLDLKKLIERASKLPELEAKVQLQEKKSTIADAARSVDFNADALSEVIESKGLALEERDVREEQDGKKVTVKRWCVRKAGDDKGEWTPLDEYAETNLKVFMPALTAVAEEGGEENESGAGERRGGSSQQQRQGRKGEREPEGTRWPDQNRSRKPNTKTEGASDDEIRRNAIDSGIYTPL